MKATEFVMPKSTSLNLAAAPSVSRDRMEAEDPRRPAHG
jgi:hypothetical protein